MTIDLREFDNEIILHFGGKRSDINAETLTRSIDAVVNLIKAINAGAGGGRQIDIRITAIAPGCFQVSIAWEIYSIAKMVGAGLLILVIYDALKGEKSTPTKVHQHKHLHFEVADEDYKLLMDEETQKLYMKLSFSAEVNNNLLDLMKALKDSKDISEFGIANPKTDRKPKPLIRRKDFGVIARRQRKEAFKVRPSNRIPASTHEESHDVTEETLTVIRAIFARGRKWEFMDGSGMKIPALIRSDEFYDKLLLGQYSVAAGTKLRVQLATHKIREGKTNRWHVKSYEVIEVLDVISSDKPEMLDDPPD
jgi:hypothetical protein